MPLVVPAARRAFAPGLVTFLALGLAGSRQAGAAPAPPAAGSPPRAAAAPPPKAAVAPGKGMQWVDSYDEAVARAKKERKLVLLDFYTDWCGWCKRLDKDVFSQASFLEAADGVLAVKINAEKRPDLAQRYRVTSYPKLFVLNSDGTTIERIRGYLSLADFTAKVAAVKRGETEFARMRNAAMDPTNLPAIYSFARYLADDRQHEAAIQYWQQVHDLSLQQLFQNPAAPAPMNTHRESLLELAVGYASVGLDDVARQNYDEVLRVYPDHAPSAAQALLGLARLELKRPGGQSKATGYLDRLVKEYAGTPAASEALRMRQAMQAQVTTSTK